MEAWKHVLAQLGFYEQQEVKIRSEDTHQLAGNDVGTIGSSIGINWDYVYASKQIIKESQKNIKKNIDGIDGIDKLI